jgi:hypothetical protein
MPLTSSGGSPLVIEGRALFPYDQGDFMRLLCVQRLMSSPEDNVIKLGAVTSTEEEALSFLNAASHAPFM